MRLRLIGDPTEIADALDQIRTVLQVDGVTATYPTRGQTGDVRVYATLTTIKAGLDSDSTAAQAL